MSIYIEILSGILIILGSIFVLISASGLLKMPDLYMRTSVTTKASTIGVGMVLLGTAVYFEDLGIYARAILIIIFIFMTAPIGSHLIGRAGFLDKVELWKGTIVNELEDKYSEDKKTLK